MDNSKKINQGSGSGLSNGLSYDLTWPGYVRKNGKLGIRNHILVIYTVKCSEFVAKRIVEEAGDLNVECIGFDGCTDNQYAVNLLISMIRHPNIGAVLAVGLGCEYVQPEWLAGIAREEGKPAEWMFIQDKGGTAPAIAEGLEIVRRMQEELKNTPTREMGFSDLIIGAECGGSDFTSGLAGNVVVGRLYDKLVEAGGTAIFEEIVEAVGLDSLLVKRAKTEQAAKELQFTYDKALDYCKSVRQYSVSPGNFAGGLSTIEEKSMGAVIKSGSAPISGVVKVACTPPEPGLWLLDSTPDPHWMQFGITNPNDNEGLMDLISAGAHIVFLVTGRGNVVGSAVSPCIKITGNRETYRRMEGDMDFDASGVLFGECSQEEMTHRLYEMVAAVAGGAPSKSEALGHKEYFIPYKFQEKFVTFKRKCEEEV
ncbi:MAG: UxaA family hydrolase [Eubacteriales bacterium]|nr:UxaA family hydrolase [Eubacteriales bacterium]